MATLDELDVAWLARRLYVGVSGPSAVGKGVIVRGVLERIPALRRVRMVTDRPPRTGEVPGEQFDHVSSATLREADEAGRLAAIDSPYALASYAVTHEALAAIGEGEAGILECDYEHIRQIARRYPIVSILVLAPSLDVSRRRLEARCEHSADEVRQRLYRTRYLLTSADRYDHICLNDVVAEAIDFVAQVVTVEIARLERDRLLGLAASQSADAVRYETLSRRA